MIIDEEHSFNCSFFIKLNISQETQAVKKCVKAILVQTHMICLEKQ